MKHLGEGVIKIAVVRRELLSRRAVTGGGAALWIKPVKIGFIGQKYFDKSFDNDILNHCQADW